MGRRRRKFFVKAICEGGAEVVQGDKPVSGLSRVALSSC